MHWSRKGRAVLSCSVMSDSLATSWTIAHQAPLSMGFPRQEYWSELPSSFPGHLPDPGIEPESPELAGGFFTTALYDPATPLLGMYPKETIIERDTCTLVFIAALFTIARTWKQRRCPLTDKWIKCDTYIQWNITQP